MLSKARRCYFASDIDGLVNAILKNRQVKPLFMWLVGFVAPILYHNCSSQNAMNHLLHKPAPAFSLPNQDGILVNLADYLGRQPVVLFFYPGDFTPGCTREACSFRDFYSDFAREGITVFGISADSVEKHKRFKEAYQLPYDLLSDPKEEVARLYKVGKTLFLKNRVTFIVNKEGLIVDIYDSPIFFERHARRALEALTRPGP